MMIPNWNWGQWKAVGRHAATYSAGIVTALVAVGLVSTQQGTDITTDVNSIVSGIESIAKGIGGLVAVITPIYTMWRAAHASSPQAQMQSVVTNLSAPEIVQAANAVDDPNGRNRLIDAVSRMDEVKKIVTTPEVATATPSRKVVSQ